jgi:hypothetical protein
MTVCSLFLSLSFTPVTVNTKIYSTGSAFAALKADGSITAWGKSDNGGSDAPTDSGYTKIYSNTNGTPRRD